MPYMKNGLFEKRSRKRVYACFRNLLTKISRREDQYRIIFLGAVWPERLHVCVLCLEKSLEMRDAQITEIDEHWSELDLRQGNLGWTIAGLMAEGLGRSWTHSRPLKIL